MWPFCFARHGRFWSGEQLRRHVCVRWQFAIGFLWRVSFSSAMTKSLVVFFFFVMVETIVFLFGMVVSDVFFCLLARCLVLL